ncbi:MAG: D-alanine--D-alanine ligase, partial [Dehalococcoidia bacterium]|nr:D-alanine--D-alanine ligase [Dehalococcoidia bacterium]
LHQQEVEDALEEYDSPETVEAIASVFRNQGHLVIKLGGGRNFLEAVLKEKVDFVFNIAEGNGNYRSREAQVPSVLEMLDIPYSGADPQCLAICLDKPLTKRLVALAGVETPRWMVFDKVEDVDYESMGGLNFPVFVKPSWEGSSKGVRKSSKIDDFDRLVEVVSYLIRAYRQPVMVEEFVLGEEVTVGVLGNYPPRIVGIMHIVPKQPDPYFVYSLEVKRDWERLVRYECPARFPSAVMKRIEESALRAYRTLGCRDFGRLDFRVTPDGVPYFLEINPLPGLNPHSGDLPIMAGLMGLSYESLITAVFDAALGRYRS